MGIDNDIIPVVMFHSVGLNNSNWVFSHISEPVNRFEEKLAMLRQTGYHFLFWNELYEHMAGLRPAPSPSIMLTFDDGYLDNWVYVYPLLEKYGAKGTIFVSPDFVDPEPNLRPNLKDVWGGKIPIDELPGAGFLNWAEMRIMEASGIVDIQSHALTHTWYFSGPELLDFHRPGNSKYPWLSWNARPERKPYYMNENQDFFTPWGLPIYQHEKALIGHRYFPPQEVLDGITGFVADHGGADFFAADGWCSQLVSQHERLMSQYGGNSRWEDEHEYQSRVYHELKVSKAVIEKYLEKRVDFICWPGGGYNKSVLKLARSAGYLSWTFASRDQSHFRNRYAVGPEFIKRVSSFSRYQMPGGRPLGYAGGRYFIYGLERHKGSRLYTWLGRLLLLKSWLCKSRLEK